MFSKDLWRGLTILFFGLGFGLSPAKGQGLPSPESSPPQDYSLRTRGDRLEILFEVQIPEFPKREGWPRPKDQEVRIEVEGSSKDPFLDSLGVRTGWGLGGSFSLKVTRVGPERLEFYISTRSQGSVAGALLGPHPGPVSIRLDLGIQDFSIWAGTKRIFQDTYLGLFPAQGEISLQVSPAAQGRLLSVRSIPGTGEPWPRPPPRDELRELVRKEREQRSQAIRNPCPAKCYRCPCDEIPRDKLQNKNLPSAHERRGMRQSWLGSKP